jgi:hypothetical protein
MSGAGFMGCPGNEVYPLNFPDQENRHRIPSIFKGLSAARTALHLDLVYRELLKEKGLDIPPWLEYDIWEWREKIERYQEK